nr:MAG TPA: Helix-turn-helix XRE-family like protein [Caudoviricetes sp.]
MKETAKYKVPRRTNNSPIAKRRMELGMTQQQLAEKVGCYAKDVSRWENGVFVPHVETMLKIATVLDCTIDDLVE